MKIATFAFGCFLAALSGVGLAFCLGIVWYLNHPPAEAGAFSPAQAGDTAIGTLIFSVLLILLGAASNLLIGLAAQGMGAQRESGG